MHDISYLQVLARKYSRPPVFLKSASFLIGGTQKNGQQTSRPKIATNFVFSFFVHFRFVACNNTTIQMSRQPGTTSPPELKSSNRSGIASGMIRHPVTIPKYLYTNDASGRSRNAGRKCLRDSSSGEDNALANSLRKLFNSVVSF
jgi:hypothetical protein